MNGNSGSEAMAMGGMDGGMDFDGLLARALRVRRDEAEAPAGMVQRLKARLAQEAAVVQVARPFAFAESVRTRRSAATVWMAVTAHAAVLAVLFTLAAERMRVMAPKQRLAEIGLRLTPPPVRPSLAAIGGGGGAHDVAPVTKGRLPELAQQQMVPPMAPPTIPPKLAVEPSVVVQPELKMAANAMPNLGMPNAPAATVGSLGTGSGGGIGSGAGSGIGPGSGGNTGGGVYSIGGGVKAPTVVYAVDAEYSEEARKAKFDGNVMVELVVDEQGRPSHVHVVQSAGMGLDETAVAAVRQYRFRPATKDGKPVKVQLDIEVNYQIF